MKKLNDAQAMELVKKHRLFIYGYRPFWVVSSSNPNKIIDTKLIMTDGEDLNRAICELVAKMQAAK